MMEQADLNALIEEKNRLVTENYRLEKAVKGAVADEREACAKLVEGTPAAATEWPARCAAAIRARGKS